MLHVNYISTKLVKKNHTVKKYLMMRDNVDDILLNKERLQNKTMTSGLQEMYILLWIKRKEEKIYKMLIRGDL